MLSSTEFVGRLRAELVAQGTVPPAVSLSRLDQVELLRGLLLDAQRQGVPALDRLPLKDLRVFFPWGLRLASLLEECLIHNLTPSNIPLPEEQAPPFAAALLEELGMIHTLYLERLDANSWTTPGRDAALVAAHGLSAALDFERRENLAFFLAGFAQLNGAEDALYKGLWERGALQVLWHADPRLALGPEAQPHWSCEELRRWRRRWNAGIERFDETPDPASGPRVALVEGFDLHSQLDALGRILAAQANEQGLKDTAVVLPATELLLPTLHHLPHASMPEGVNVSMGYPLNRSALAQLVEILLRLQENAPQRGVYHWRDCVDLIRLPYLKMLSPLDEFGNPTGRTLRTICHELENHCRRAGKHLDPRAWTPKSEELAERLPLAREDELQGMIELLALLLERCITAWEGPPDLASLADALEGVCDALVRHGAALWPRFPLDAECLHRLLYSVIPTLRQSLLSRSPLPQEALFAILRGILEEERAPFEAEPLGGLQLLGLLETRLLRFERLYILDATDSKLPGGASRDPLLPDSLRPALGLPDERVRECVAAYVFHRLVNGAREATILYQSSSQGVGLLEEKCVRSRYVEELIWEEEKNRRALIAPGDPLVSQITYPIKPIPSQNRSIPKTHETRARLQARLLSPISPSALDCYLRCPARFFYEHVARLAPLDSFVEEGDPAALGALLHDILKEYFTRYLNTPISKESLDKAELQALFSARLSASELFGQLPFDQRLLLEKTGRRRLAQLIESTPETTIIALETPCKALVSADLGGRPVEITLNGRLDRVDLRPDGAWILDYKTGSVKKTASDLWEDSSIWDAIDAWGELDEEEAEALQTHIAQKISSAQLPCYLYLSSKEASKTNALQACYVALRDDGKEIPLFPEKTPPEQRSHAVETLIPKLLRFLVGRLHASSRFFPNPDKHCDYCPYHFACEE
jgi:hypothetical protein